VSLTMMEGFENAELRAWQRGSVADSVGGPAGVAASLCVDQLHEYELACDARPLHLLGRYCRRPDTMITHSNN